MNNTHCNRIDLTGKKFGRWTVVKGLPSINQRAYWLCKCDCGTERSTPAGVLLSGQSKSCGCLSKEIAAKIGRANRFDLTGKKFGRLTVLKFDDKSRPSKTRWICKCKCGVVKSVSAVCLLEGLSRSCGCLHSEMTSATSRINMAGKRFGRLIAIRYIKRAKKLAHWLCRCDCGKEVTVSGSNMRSGVTKSCGCLRVERLSGVNSPFWKGGITPQIEKIRKSIEYRLWREAVFSRDNWTCQECGKRGSIKLHAHHIKSFSKFPATRFAIDNGETLCVPCHNKTPNYMGRANKKKL